MKGDYSVGGFRSIHRPQNREDLRFVNHEGRLKNRLRKTVPSLVASAVGELVPSEGLGKKEAPVLHGGGRDVLDALEPVLAGRSLGNSRDVLRSYGNLSSPSLFVGLENTLEFGSGGVESFWLCGFGAGFSAHSARLTRIS